MRPYGKAEIKDKAQACFNRQISGNGLVNAKKIITKVKQMLAAETKRRTALTQKGEKDG